MDVAIAYVRVEPRRERQLAAASVRAFLNDRRGPMRGLTRA